MKKNKKEERSKIWKVKIKRWNKMRMIKTVEIIKKKEIFKSSKNH